jgi:hypothetical protein
MAPAAGRSVPTRSDRAGACTSAVAGDAADREGAVARVRDEGALFRPRDAEAARAPEGFRGAEFRPPVAGFRPDDADFRAPDAGFFFAGVMRPSASSPRPSGTRREPGSPR